MFEDLIKSKARECEVEREKLPSPSVFLEDIQTKILENEYIPRETKEKLLKDIGNLQETLETGESPMVVESETTGIVGSSLFAFMTVNVLILTILFVALNIYGPLGLLPQSVIAPMVISMLSILATALAYWTRSAREKKVTSKEKVENENKT